MKKFCVLFLSQEDWDEPGVVFVEAETEDDAYDLGLKKIGYTEDEIEEMQEYGNYSIEIMEVK